MNNNPIAAPEPDEPQIKRSRWRMSPVWLVPLIAALIGLSMLVHAWYANGPEVEILFKTATGLEAGKTPVKYKDVTVGGVSGIALSEDRTHVIVTVSLLKNAASLAREDSRFWVVRPRIGAGGVTGIDTLLSGAYIGVDAGASEKSGRKFTGLETPPPVIGGMPGRTFVVRADDLGSLDIGAPVYYRRIQVGRVASYSLDEDGKGVSVQIFIDAPYDRFVTSSARFWNASGVDVSLSAAGLKLNTQSLATVLAGGIAFATPPGSPQGEPAAENARFALEKDQQAALAPPDGTPQRIRLLFEQSLRGLAAGAPVEFSGIDLGRVTSIHLDYDAARRRFMSVVDIEIFPERLGRVLEKLPNLKGSSEEQGAQFLKIMVANGLRAQAKSANILTGQLYVSLDFIRNAPAAAFDMAARPLMLPTVRGEFDQLQEQVSSIVAKVEKMPLDSIGRNLDASLASVNKTLGTLDKTLGTFDKTLGQVNGEVLPEAANTMRSAQQALGAAQELVSEDAPLRQDLGQTLQELRRTARSVRGLTDLLGEHPEALVKGRPKDAPLQPAPPLVTPLAPPAAPLPSRTDTQEKNR
ncbi:MAG: MCE family protein [Comamonadaceae bacterium]|nr:MAG: MCE family protein [Comamonadaceae bacterium]